MERSLPDTLRMLQRSGIDAGARPEGQRLHVWIDRPAGPGASFSAREASRAADWLVEQAVRLHPRCDIAKLHGLVAAAYAAVARGET